MTSRISKVLNQAPNLRKPENVIQTFRNTSETFVSEGKTQCISLAWSTVVFGSMNFMESSKILENQWFSIVFHWFSLFSLIFHQISEICIENRTKNQEKSRFSKFQKICSFYCSKLLCFFTSKSCYAPRVLVRNIFCRRDTGYPTKMYSSRPTGLLF